MHWWLYIFQQDFFQLAKLYRSINYGKSWRSLTSKAAPKHDTTITMFDCQGDSQLTGCLHMSNVTWYTSYKKFYFCFFSPQNIFPKILSIIKMILENVRQAFMFFWVSSSVDLGNLPYRQFLPNLTFSLLNLKLGP